MIVYGAGADFERLIKDSRYKDLVECVIDSDEKKVGNVICGIPVVSKDCICQFTSAEIIWISSLKFYREIAAVIRSMNKNVGIRYLGENSIFINEKRISEDEKQIKLNNLSYCIENEKNLYEEYKDVFCDNSEEFKVKYTNLIKDLDMASAMHINRIIKRLRTVYSGNYDVQSLITLDEVEEFNKIAWNMQRNVLMIDNDLFVYGKYKLPLNYFIPKYFVNKGGMTYVDNLDFVRNGDIIDCGAFIGDSSLFYSEYTDNHVFAVEAQRSNCELIEKTISLNDASSIKILNTAVGNEKGNTVIYHHENGNWGTINPYQTREYTEKEDVEVNTIDDLVEKYRINCSLIKADIEGCESDMLIGARKTLIKFKPTLIICLHHTARDFFEIKPYLESLNLGYKFKIWKLDPNLIMTGTVLIAECEH